MIIPTDDKLLIKRLEEDDKSPGGILLPDVARSKSMRGKVLAVGPGKISLDNGIRHPMPAVTGQVVLFAQYAGMEVKGEAGEELLIIRADDVLARIG